MPIQKTAVAAMFTTLAAAALQLAPPPETAHAQAQAPPGIVLARVATPTRVAARDGVAVWGAYDKARDAIVLMRRSTIGVIAPVGVPLIPAIAASNEIPGRPASVATFEVTLGHDSGHRLTAVYRRCAGPADSSCSLALATIATGVERRVANTEGALRGAISGPWVAFVTSGSGADRLYLRHVGRDPRALAPPKLGADREAARIDPKGSQPDPSSVRISSVDVRGRDVAYVVNYRLRSPEIAYSELWLNRGPGRNRKVAYVGTGGASSGFRELLQPRLYADSVVSYMQGRDQTNAVFRYSLSGRVLGSGSIGIKRLGIQPEITGGQWDRGRFWYSANPYQGNGCGDFEQLPFDATCPVLDSGPVALARSKPRVRR